MLLGSSQNTALSLLVSQTEDATPREHLRPLSLLENHKYMMKFFEIFVRGIDLVCIALQGGGGGFETKRSIDVFMGDFYLRLE